MTYGRLEELTRLANEAKARGDMSCMNVGLSVEELLWLLDFVRHAEEAEINAGILP